MSRNSKPIRILAIDPGTRDMGLALFEGESLVRYWVKGLSKEKLPERVLEKGKRVVIDLIQRFSPKVLVLGKLTHPRNKKNPVLRKLVNQIRLLARKRRIKLYGYEPEKARESIISDNQRVTKRNTARLIASLYPELSGYIPRERRILWKERDFYWVNVFDACSLALTYLKQEGAGTGNQIPLNERKALSQ
jgi:Holliday junction resolvasome RuvABC endonuclease subunit